MQKPCANCLRDCVRQVQVLPYIFKSPHQIDILFFMERDLHLSLDKLWNDSLYNHISASTKRHHDSHPSHTQFLLA